MTQILSGWRINALLCQVFPVRKGGAVRSKCIVQTPSPFFFFFFPRDDLELRIRQHVAEMRSYRDVRRDSLVCTVTLESERERKKNKTENVFESGACGGVFQFLFYAQVNKKGGKSLKIQKKQL